jgi:hypothetical protein
LKVAVLFLLLTAAATFPLANVFRPALPDSDDAQFTVWRISWVAHQLRSDPAHLFDGNIFHPASNTLAYSDAMLVVAVAGAPLIWAGVHPIVVHNLLLLAAILSSALASYALCKALTGDRLAAIFGGVVFALAPYRMAHIGHLELQWATFMPLTLLVLHRVGGAGRSRDRPLHTRGVAAGLRTGRVSAGILAGILLALQGLASLYYFAFFGIYLAAWSMLMLVASAREARWPMLRTLAVAGVTAVVVIAPYLAIYAAARQTLGPREQTEIQQFSATPADYARVSGESETYPSGPLDAQDERSLFPGIAAIALALCGIAIGRGPLRFVYAVLAMLAVDLSFGSNGLLYPLLLRALPALSSLRAPARFGVLVLLSLSVLSAIGLSAVTRRLAARTRAIAVAVVILIALAEYWSAPIGTRRLPLEPPNVYRQLAAEPDAVVLELPVPDPARLWGSETTHELMSIYHWRPLINGYSGHAPEDYIVMLETIRDGTPERISARLQSLGVNTLVLHEKLYGADGFTQALNFWANLPGAGPPQAFVDPVDPAVLIPLGKQ